MAIDLKFVCGKCGAMQPRNKDKSTANWDVFDANAKCSCGGKYEFQVAEKKHRASKNEK